MEGVGHGHRGQGLVAPVGADAQGMAGGDGELVGVLSDGDMTEPIDGGEGVVVECTEGLPVGGVEADGGVGDAVAADGADDHDDAGAVGHGQ